MSRKTATTSFLVLILSFVAAPISAGGFATVSPLMLDLSLEPGESAVEAVSVTIDAFCVRPVDVDVVASDLTAPIVNLSGVITNNCGGDTSTFDIQLTGTNAPQSFDLLFIDSESGSDFASIPVEIQIAEPAEEPLMGVLVRKPVLVFQVFSSGCTTKADFRVDVRESNPLQVTLVRLQRDPCDAFEPLGTLIPFSYRELGIAPGAELRIVNPLGVVEAPPAFTPAR